jgi:hypothetical protein
LTPIQNNRQDKQDKEEKRRNKRKIKERKGNREEGGSKEANKCSKEIE